MAVQTGDGRLLATVEKTMSGSGRRTMVRYGGAKGTLPAALALPKTNANVSFGGRPRRSVSYRKPTSADQLQHLYNTKD